jgi:hypothetical protein
MIFYESVTLEVENKLLEDPDRPFAESAIGDIAATGIRAIYPMIRALNSDRLTRNFTFYPKKAVRGRKDPKDPTGYSSFVLPYGKPVLRDHRVKDTQVPFGGVIPAEVPYGRVLYAGFKSRRANEISTPPADPMFPGTFEGSGYMGLVPIISDQRAVEKILTGAFQTTSIASTPKKVTESISGVDIIKAAKEGELPPYERGQVYMVDGKKQLSYYIMHGIRGIEVSFVNQPADELAGVIDPDIGEGGIRVLLGEKKVGSNEFSLFDPATNEKLFTYDPEEGGEDYFGFDEGTFEPGLHAIDSVNPLEGDWFFLPSKPKKFDESVSNDLDLLNSIIEGVLGNESEK